jgi:hypothetical protein
MIEKIFPMGGEYKVYLRSILIGLLCMANSVKSFLNLKRIVKQYFLLPFFFRWLIFVQIDKPESDFEFCRIFVELFVFEIPRN